MGGITDHTPSLAYVHIPEPSQLKIPRSEDLSEPNPHWCKWPSLPRCLMFWPTASRPNRPTSLDSSTVRSHPGTKHLPSRLAVEVMSHQHHRSPASVVLDRRRSSTGSIPEPTSTSVELVHHKMVLDQAKLLGQPVARQHQAETFRY